MDGGQPSLAIPLGCSAFSQHDAVSGYSDLLQGDWFLGEKKEPPGLSHARSGIGMHHSHHILHGRSDSEEKDIDSTSYCVEEHTYW